MIQEAQLTRGDDSYFLVEDDDEDAEPEIHEEEEVSTAEKTLESSMVVEPQRPDQFLTLLHSYDDDIHFRM